MKTATEFFDEGNFNNVTDMLIEFAKMHVQEALRLASVEAEVEHKLSNPYDPNSEYQIVNKDSILNAYSLGNIK